MQLNWTCSEKLGIRDINENTPNEIWGSFTNKNEYKSFYHVLNVQNFKVNSIAEVDFT